MPATAGFDKRLAAVMDSKGVTQSQLAEESAVGRSTINAWLQGAVPVQMAPVRKVATSLGVSFESLWGEVRQVDLDEQTRLAQLEHFARRVQELLDELELPPIAVRRVAENSDSIYDPGTQQLEAPGTAPAEQGRLARDEAPPATDDVPRSAKARKRR